MRRWDVIAELLNREQLQTFAEIGTKEGRLTAFILEHCPQVKVYACDPWMAFPATNDPQAETYEGWDFEQIEQEFHERTAPWADRLEFMRTTGHSMAKRIPDRSLDCAFIDARHDYASVLDDIGLWYGKVRPGGWMTGHDFNHKWPGVMRAVAEHFNLMHVVSGEDSVWMFQRPSV